MLESNIFDCVLDNYEIKDLIKNFCNNLKHNEEIKNALINQLIAVSINSEFNKCQYQTLKFISKILGFSNGHVDDILKNLGIYNKWFENETNNENKNYKENSSKSYKNPYEILGVSENDDLETIKKKYKELVRKFHPDFISGKGLDEEFIKFANEKLKEIN